MGLGGSGFGAPAVLYSCERREPVYACLPACLYLCISVCLYACMSVGMHVCTHAHVRIYVYMGVHTYVYAETYRCVQDLDIFYGFASREMIHVVHLLRMRYTIHEVTEGMFICTHTWQSLPFPTCTTQNTRIPTTGTPKKGSRAVRA